MNKPTRLRRLIALFGACATFAMAISSFAAQGRLVGQTQLNPTNARLTLNAILQPRQTQTAQVMLQFTQTRDALATQTAFSAVMGTLLAQSITPTPSSTPTVSSTATITLSPTPTSTGSITPSDTATITPLPSATPVPTLTQPPTRTATPAPVTAPPNISPTVRPVNATPTALPNSTQISQMIQTDIARFLTGTAVQATVVGGTQVIQATFSAVLTALASPPAALTPTVTPTSTYAPPNETQIAATVSENINRLLTGTAVGATQRAGTQAVQATFNAIVQTLTTQTPSPSLTLSPTTTPSLTPSATVTRTLTATITVSPTATPTSTLSAENIQATIENQINLNLTQTVAAAIVRTDTANVRATINAIQQANATATTNAIRATVTLNYLPLLSSTITGLSEIGKFEGHTGTIEGVAFSPDGSLVATSSRDNTVRVWNVLTGESIRVLAGLTNRLGVVFSADGTTLIASSTDGTVRTWNARTFEEKFTFQGHTEQTTAVNVSSVSPLIVSVSGDRTARLWNYETNAAAGVLRGHNGAVIGAAFTHDGTRVVTGGDTSAIVWETRTAIRLSQFRDSQSIYAIAISPDDRLIAAGGSFGNISLVDLATNNRIATLPTAAGPVTSMAFCPDGSCLVAVTYQGTILIYDVPSRNRLTTLRIQGAATYIAMSPDGTRMAVVGTDRIVHIYGIPLNPRGNP